MPIYLRTETQIEHKIAQTMDRLLETDQSSVVKAYEKRIGDLEAQKLLLNERIDKCGRPLDTYEETFEHPKCHYHSGR